ELASQYDYLHFYEREMNIRRSFLYPPYVFLTLITVSHENEFQVYDVIQKIRQMLEQMLQTNTMILGPTPASIPRIKNRYRYQLMVKYRSEPNLHIIIQEVLDTFKKARQQGVQIIADMNPYQLMKKGNVT